MGSSDQEPEAESRRTFLNVTCWLVIGGLLWIYLFTQGGWK